MKEAEATLLMKSGVIESAVFVRRDVEQGWELWLHGEELPPSVRNPIELARGGRRTWASLDTGHDWLMRFCGGRKIRVEIEG